MTNSKTTNPQVGQTIKFSLIDGVFQPEDAATILFNLISDKIKFHNTLVLSTYEHSGEVNEKSQERIEALATSKNEVNELIKQAQKHGFELKINSEINIELVKK